jgi:ubiquinone/menaquinone biosynthesis C-methylase UbiE
MSHTRVVETFDRWADEGRDAELEHGHGDVARQVIERMAIRPGERILDVGCGNGWATRLLARAAAGVQAIGVDASPRMIARADALHSLTIRARYDLASFEALPFKDAHFDRVFSMEALYYAGDLERAASEIARVLKPGGQLDVLIDYYEESPASEPWARTMGLDLHRLGEAGWRALFERRGLTALVTARVRDSRGPGDPDSPCNECQPTYQAKLALHQAGTLWVHGEKPR